MSHVSVLVIGDGVEGQLAPYDANLPVSDDDCNPRAQWDWWQVGGRWRGSVLRVKPGATSGVLTPEDLYARSLGVPDDAVWPNYVDACRAGDVDWYAIRDDLAARARDLWRRFHTVAGDLPFTTLDAMLDQHGGGSRDVAVAEYRSQPLIVALRASADPELNRLGSDGIASVMAGETSYVEREAGQALTFAVVKDGEWYERGEMRWFGTAMGEKSQDEWAEEFAELVRDLDPATMLTVVDCHS